MVTQILAKIPDIIELVALLFMAISILATLIARITPTKKDDEIIETIAGYGVRVLAWLPTIGVNPKTKEIVAAYHALKTENIELKAKNEVLKEITKDIVIPPEMQKPSNDGQNS